MKASLFDLQLERWLRARNNGDIVWTTKEGNQIPIKSMSDTHLVNTINMLERKSKEAETSIIEEIELEEAIASYDWEKFGY